MITVGQTYRHVPTGLPCTVTEINRVSVRMMGTLSDGRTAHDIPSHDLVDLPPATPSAPAAEAAPAAEEATEDEDAKGLLTPRQFSARLRRGE